MTPAHKYDVTMLASGNKQGNDNTTKNKCDIPGIAMQGLRDPKSHNMDI